MVVRSGKEVDSSGKSAGKGALIQTERASTINTVQDQYLFQPTAYSFDPLSSNSMKSKNPHSGCREVEVSRTIDTTDPNPSKNQGGLAIVEPIPIHDQATRFSGKRGDKADGKGNGLGIGAEGDAMNTLTAGDRHAVAYGVDCRNATETPECNGTVQAKPNGGFSLNCNQVVRVQYIVRRLTPTECARLQGFADWHGHLEQKTELTDEEHSFWLEVRNTHAAINGKAVKDYTKPQMLTWYNKLWTDGAEYKMWGNGVSLPTILYCMQGIAEVLNREEDDSWLM
jgi:DNA (cytosine-5)-methyltransferase 1